MFEALKILLILVGFFICPFLSSGQNSGFSPGDATYLWPTDASRYLSSTFGETRSAHFHSALDLKTWGRRGYKVFATRDGTLHRIAIGPKGYGKVVYLKHKDGSYSVYAHLLKFADRIQQFADSVRFRDYSFEINRTLDGSNIQIKQGDVIGLSGASGIGPPHLHFELRTPDEKPFNPLLTNLSINDQIPPRFSRLSVEPLSATSTIEDKNEIFTKRAQSNNGVYSFGTIDAEGAIGLGVDVFDKANNVHNAYAVYELKMYIDGSKVFHSKVDSFAYSETDQLFLDRVYSILKQKGAGFQRLYITDGNTLPFYERTQQNGKLNLEPGTHAITLTASDFYGNTSSASLRLRVRSGSRSSFRFSGPEKTAHAESPPMNPGIWDWYDNWVTIPEKNISGINIVPLGMEAASASDPFQKHKNEVSVDLALSRDMFFRTSSRDHFIARRVYPGSFSIVPSTTHDAFAAFNRNSVYDTLSAGLHIRSFRKDSVKIDVMPESQPLRASFQLAYALDSVQAAIPNLAFYKYNRRKDKLSYVPSQHKNQYLVSQPKVLGPYYILNDTTSPRIGQPHITRRVDGQWLVMAPVEDNLSGIGFKRAEFYVNGTRGIAEYEPEDDRLVYYHPGFTPEDRVNHVRIIVFDKLGNRREATFDLSFEAGKK